MRLIVVVLLSLFALPAAAQTVRQEVFEGTIGKSPVVMEITTYREGAKTFRAAQYFYTKYRTPITLTPGANAQVFTEDDPDCVEASCRPKATLTLNADGDRLVGTWQAVRKPATPVAIAMRRISVREYVLKEAVTEAPAMWGLLWSDDAPAAVDGNLYLQRLYDTDLVDGTEVATGGIGYRPVTHKGTGVHYVRLTRHPDAAVLKAVNARLDVRRYQFESEAQDCIAMGRQDSSHLSYDGFGDTSIAVSYLTSTLMFVEEGGSTYCGGAHPNNFWTRNGYDLKTGGRLDMNRLLKLYDKSAGDDPPETADYKALKAKLTPKSPWFVGGEDIPECLTEEVGYPYSLSFNDKGLVFSLVDLPFVMAACDGDYYVVPYSELKALWRPEAKAYFPGL